eukprot:5348752-Pleurochrysis_carterae.AAC.17
MCKCQKREKIFWACASFTECAAIRHSPGDRCTPLPWRCEGRPPARTAPALAASDSDEECIRVKSPHGEFRHPSKETLQHARQNQLELNIYSASVRQTRWEIIPRARR